MRLLVLKNASVLVYRVWTTVILALRLEGTVEARCQFLVGCLTYLVYISNFPLGQDVSAPYTVSICSV